MSDVQEALRTIEEGQEALGEAKEVLEEVVEDVSVKTTEIVQPYYEKIKTKVLEFFHTIVPDLGTEEKKIKEQ